MKRVGLSGRQDSPAHLFPILLALFVGSGIAALIYEIVWFQMLELTVGSSAVSIAVLLATYMGGMCIGSIALSRFVRPGVHPLKVYALIEFGIGACGILAFVTLPYAGGIYAAVGGHGAGGLLVRGLLSAVTLLPPTILMGATLPAVSRYVEGTSHGVRWMGYLYGGNTLGAVVGTLFAGYYLLRVFDMLVATLVAVAVNVAIGLLALVLSRRGAYDAPVQAAARPGKKKQVPAPQAARWPVLVTIGLSGFTALASEVVWTRVLSLHLGATVYTYSIILAAVLLGIGLGSYLGAWLTRFEGRSRTLLGVCQALLTVAMAWAAYLVIVVYPVSPNDAALAASPVTAFGHDLWQGLAAMLPAALLWGASFPLALAATERDGEDPGISVGLVYASNTLGAIVGSLGSSLVLMALIGSDHIQQLLIVTAAASSVLVLLPLGVTRAPKGKRAQAMRPAWLVAVPVVLAVAMAPTIRPVPGQLVGYGPAADKWQPGACNFIYIGEGMNSSVAISQQADGIMNYHNAGKVQASSQPGDLRLERMLGHLTTLQADDPKEVLVIGCGAGVTAGAVSVDPRVENLTICEIEPLVPKAASTYFGAHNAGVVTNPKTRVVIDDGRHFLMTSKQKYDAITCDPFDPWTKGAASLATVEFFESAKEHLNPGGTITFWVPLYQMRMETAKSEIGTFTKVFPNSVIWDNVTGGGGDIVLSARVGGGPIDLDTVERSITGPQFAPLRESLASVGFDSVDALFASYTAHGPDLKDWLADAEINTDRNLRLQYLAGIGFGSDETETIFGNIASYGTWPKDLFAGSPDRLHKLEKACFSQ